MLNEKPLIIADIGHNLQAFKMIASELERYSTKTIYFILGVSNDKNIEQMLSALPTDINYILTQSKTDRAISTSQLKNKMTNFIHDTLGDKRDKSETTEKTESKIKG